MQFGSFDYARLFAPSEAMREAQLGPEKLNPGFRERPLTEGATFDTKLGEFILPYDTVRSAADPDALLLDFLSTTYSAAADTGAWDRAQLECAMGVPGEVRRLSPPTVSPR